MVKPSEEGYIFYAKMFMPTLNIKINPRNAPEVVSWSDKDSVSGGVTLNTITNSFTYFLNHSLETVNIDRSTYSL